jgi:hypothetical protein
LSGGLVHDGRLNLDWRVLLCHDHGLWLHTRLCQLSHGL